MNKLLKVVLGMFFVSSASAWEGSVGLTNEYVVNGVDYEVADYAVTGSVSVRSDKEGVVTSGLFAEGTIVHPMGERVNYMTLAAGWTNDTFTVGYRYNDEGVVDASYDEVFGSYTQNVGKFIPTEAVDATVTVDASFFDDYLGTDSNAYYVAGGVTLSNKNFDVTARLGYTDFSDGGSYADYGVTVGHDFGDVLKSDTNARVEAGWVSTDSDEDFLAEDLFVLRTSLTF